MIATSRQRAHVLGGSGAARRLAGVATLASILLAIAPRPAAAQSSFSRHEDGALVLYLLLKDVGYQLSRISDEGQLTDGIDVLVVLGEARPTRTRAVQRWAERGRLVVFAPPLLELGYCDDVHFGDLPVARTTVTGRAQAEVRVLSDPRLRIKAASCQLETPESGTRLVGPLPDEAGNERASSRALAYDRRLERGRLLVLAHDDLLANARIDQDDLAVVLRRWLTEHARPGARIAFLEQKRAGRFLDMLRRANLIPIALHGILWLLVLFWVVAPRFGESSPEPDTQRRRFAQHAQALGHLYLGAGASRHALSKQYERFVSRVLGSGRSSGRGPTPLGRPPASGGGITASGEARSRRAALARLVATRTGRDPASVESLLAQVEQETGAAGELVDARQAQRHFRLSQALAELQRGSVARSGGKTRGRTEIDS